MPDAVTQRLASLHIELPEPARPVGSYVAFLFAGDLLLLTGQLCHWNGERPYVGICADADYQFYLEKL